MSVGPGAVGSRGRRSEFEMGWTEREMPRVAAESLGARALGRSKSPGVGESTIKPIAGGPKGKSTLEPFFSSVSRPWRVPGAIRRRQRIVSQY